MTTTDFKIHLRKQLGFLERSCNAYDDGVHDEAIRIATIIRILIHQTSNSTSLLKHLNATTINLLSTVKKISENTIHAPMTMSTVTFSSNGAVQYPNLGNSSYKEQIPVSKWWDQVVIVNGSMRLTRKKIVRSAADQDGGAHVDTNLNSEYEQLTEAGFSGRVFGNQNGNVYEERLKGTHTICLRQMGYELLNSPELLAKSV